MIRADVGSKMKLLKLLGFNDKAKGRGGFLPRPS